MAMDAPIRHPSTPRKATPPRQRKRLQPAPPVAFCGACHSLRPVEYLASVAGMTHICRGCGRAEGLIPADTPRVREALGDGWQAAADAALAESERISFTPPPAPPRRPFFAALVHWTTAGLVLLLAGLFVLALVGIFLSGLR